MAHTFPFGREENYPTGPGLVDDFREMGTEQQRHFLRGFASAAMWGRWDRPLLAGVDNGVSNWDNGDALEDALYDAARDGTIKESYADGVKLAYLYRESQQTKRGRSRRHAAPVKDEVQS